MHPTVRDARPDDAEALARFAEAVFRATFSDDNTSADMDMYCVAAFGREIQAREIADPERDTLLAELGGELCGYAQLRPGPVPGGFACIRPHELHRIYVAPQAHGSGLGRALLQAALARARRRRATALWLGVWERNPRAIAFYRREGFRVVGSQQFLLGRDPQCDLVMVRELVRDRDGAV